VAACEVCFAVASSGMVGGTVLDVRRDLDAPHAAVKSLTEAE
jgi:hypothetical protein